ncbi:UNKNOWN [Stylonychia lemnae]|uniref:Uncharacterized protein n=1 Tax=Stylonychia lemnae TaxID=5949 RepID=A0A078A148_STYLE|nr:UNKNOWN [Stylonychia lemnae]|eukprot:CDW75966.1 UNKNOWN [Stylonychia lemnae]
MTSLIEAFNNYQSTEKIFQISNKVSEFGEEQQVGEKKVQHGSEESKSQILLLKFLKHTTCKAIYSLRPKICLDCWEIFAFNNNPSNDKQNAEPSTHVSQKHRLTDEFSYMLEANETAILNMNKKNNRAESVQNGLNQAQNEFQLYRAIGQFKETYNKNNCGGTGPDKDKASALVNKKQIDYQTIEKLKQIQENERKQLKKQRKNERKKQRRIEKSEQKESKKQTKRKSKEQKRGSQLRTGPLQFIKEKSKSRKSI